MPSFIHLGRVLLVQVIVGSLPTYATWIRGQTVPYTADAEEEKSSEYMDKFNKISDYARRNELSIMNGL